MANVKLMDVVRTLADEIGPRPTGTEEEQQAALAIQQWFKNDAGLPAAIEEVDGDPELDTVSTICFGVAFFATLLTFAVKALALPCIILALAAAVILVLENLGFSVITRFLKKGISQNVVAVYEPERMPSEAEAARAGRTRKIVLVARYDTARVRVETNDWLARFAALGNMLEMGALIAAPILMFIRFAFFMNAENLFVTILNVLIVVALVLMGIRLVKIVARRFAKYNDGANCNASGVAVLVNLAQRINGAAVSSGRTVRHGAQAAQAAGAVPAGTDLRYEAEPTAPADYDLSGEFGEYDEDGTSATGLATGAAAATGFGAVLAGLNRNRAEAATQEATPVMNAGTPWEAVEAAAQTPAEEAPAQAPVESWSGRATNSRGYATADSNMDVYARPAGAAPASDVNTEYSSAIAAAYMPASSSGNLGTIRAESGEVDYMGENPRLEAARAAVRAQRAAAGEGIEAASAPAAVPATATAGYAAPAAAPATAGYAAPAASDYVATRAATPEAAYGAYQAPAYAAPAQVSAPVAAAAVAPVAAAVEAAPAASAEPAKPAEPVIPDWYTRAKANVRHTGKNVTVARSVFNDALQSAEEVSSAAVGAIFEGEAAAPAEAVEAAQPVPVQRMAPVTEATPAPIIEAPIIAPVVATRPRVSAYAIPVEEAAQAAPVAPVAAAPAVAAAPVAPTPDTTAPVAPVAVAAPVTSPDSTAPFGAVTSAPSITAPQQIGAPAGAYAAPEDLPVLTRPTAAEVATARFDEPVSQPTTGFAGALAVAAAAEERQIAEGTLTVETAAMPTLTDLGTSSASITPLTMEGLQQRAPLAEAQTSGQQAAKSLLTMLPSISLDAPEESAPAAPAINVPQIEEAPAPTFGAAGMTAAFAPLSNDFAQDEDGFVDDADDSAYLENYTQSGAFAGPGYVDMPTHRGGSLIGKLFGKKKQQETTPQEWLGVDADFDARTAGAARGGWESFRQDFDEDEFVDGYDDDSQASGANRNWNGGGFSIKGLAQGLGKGKAKSAGRHGAQQDEFAEGDDFGYDAYNEDFDEFADGAAYDDDGFEGGYEGMDGSDLYGAPEAEDDMAGYGAYRRTLGEGDLYDEEDFADDAAEEEFAAPARGSRRSDRASRASSIDDFAAPSFSEQDKNLQEIFDFRDANIDAEVWFVALGSESPNNSGMKAFLNAHGNELRNAVFLEIEGLGAGSLSLTTTEGKFRRMKVSTRMRRYVQKAQEALNVKVGSCTYTIDNSATYQAMARGMQAMHLVGFDGAKPALQNQANDVVESIDEEKLRRNADFVMEIVRSM